MEIRENENLVLSEEFRPEKFPKRGWVDGDTAMLVAHGIGRQRPLETLDMFVRPMLMALCEYGGHEINDFTVTHLLKRKPGSTGMPWFDNVIRIEKKGSEHHLDVYEYYWANLVGERVSFGEIRKWARRTAKQARRFYDEQAEFGKKFSDSGLFFRNGKFNGAAYYQFLMLTGVLLPRIDRILNAVAGWLGGVPWVGQLLESGINALRDIVLSAFEDYVADVVAYNTDDPNSSIYGIRKNMLNGAVRAIRYLIEPEAEGEARPYRGVLIAGHSLGTEVTFDAINRINHLATQGELRGVARDGTLTAKGDASGATMEQLLLGFVSFGSPLDKVAFFFRDHSEDDACLRAQMLRHFHAFKQRDWKPSKENDWVELRNQIPRLLDGVKWRNYHDAFDPVSGRLDYYYPLVNLDCQMVEKTIQKEPTTLVQAFLALRYFSHGKYWGHLPMYGDFLANMVLKPNAADHPSDQV